MDKAGISGDAFDEFVINGQIGLRETPSQRGFFDPYWIDQKNNVWTVYFPNIFIDGVSYDPPEYNGQSYDGVTPVRIAGNGYLCIVFEGTPDSEPQLDQYRWSGSYTVTEDPYMDLNPTYVPSKLDLEDGTANTGTHIIPIAYNSGEKLIKLNYDSLQVSVTTEGPVFTLE
jgi:hypothetical protein